MSEIEIEIPLDEDARPAEGGPPFEPDLPEIRRRMSQYEMQLQEIRARLRWVENQVAIASRRARAPRTEEQS